MSNGIKKELEQIRKANGGELTAEAVVAFAKSNKKSELHGRFSWDVKTAAEAHWLHIARNIIRVHIEVIDRGDGEKTPMRAYFNPVVEKDESRSYTPTRTALSHEDTRRTIIVTQCDRLDAILSSYPLPELDAIGRAIDSARRKATSPLRVAAE
jgi:hypothetical protein